MGGLGHSTHAEPKACFFFFFFFSSIEMREISSEVPKKNDPLALFFPTPIPQPERAFFRLVSLSQPRTRRSWVAGDAERRSAEREQGRREREER